MEKQKISGGNQDLAYIIVGFIVNIVLLWVLFSYSVYAGIAYLAVWFLVAAIITWRYRIVLLGIKK